MHLVSIPAPVPGSAYNAPYRADRRTRRSTSLPHRTNQSRWAVDAHKRVPTTPHHTGPINPAGRWTRTSASLPFSSSRRVHSMHQHPCQQPYRSTSARARKCLQCILAGGPVDAQKRVPTTPDQSEARPYRSAAAVGCILCTSARASSRSIRVNTPYRCTSGR